MALVLVGVTVALAVVVSTYWNGGSRLSVGGYGMSAPVTIGEEFHSLFGLDTDGEEVTLVSAHVLGVRPGTRADVRLVRGGHHLTGRRGPLDADHDVVPLGGYRLRVDDDQNPEYWLDVRVVPTTPGIHKVDGLEVKYRTGFLRSRKVSVDMEMCLSASPDWRTDDRTGQASNEKCR